MLDQVGDVPDERLAAAFVCAVAYVDATKTATFTPSTYSA